MTNVWQEIAMALGLLQRPSKHTGGKRTPTSVLRRKQHAKRRKTEKLARRAQWRK